MGEGHSPAPAGAGHEAKLKIALALTGTYLVAEVVGGLLTGSLALLSDAAHMLTDVLALIIALIAIRVGKKPADRRKTFGYARFEILAAAFNAVVLFLVAFYILFEAVQRFKTPPEIQSVPMMIVASLGLVVNVISLRMLQSGSSTSLNMKGAYLEVLSDLVGSIGVILAALVIRFTGWWQVDPILAVLIGFWILPRTWTLFSESVNVLLEGVPKGIDLQKVYDALNALPGVREVHDLHVWEITSGQNSMTVHLLVEDPAAKRTLVEAAQQAVEPFGIDHSSIQVDAGVGASEERGSSKHPFPVSGVQ